jgi:hypothetical protein
MSASQRRADEETYLRRLEALADRVCQEALSEGWLTYLPEDADQTPLQRAINELARNLRRVHTRVMVASTVTIPRVHNCRTVLADWAICRHAR